ncbi:MAG: YbbR-like domain-containing protein [Candidatus Binatia bacterium]
MKRSSKRFHLTIFRNSRLKLFSLAFACGLWLFVNYAERDTEKTLVVPVEFRNLPSQFVIVGDRDEYVDLRLRGPSSLLSQQNSKKIRLDLSEVRPGVASFRINADMLNLPRGVRLVRISPAHLNLNIARVVKRKVPVQLHIDGEPPHGYMVKTFTLEPENIEITGPAPQVERVRELRTETLDVSKLTQPTVRELGLIGPEEELVTFAVDHVKAQVDISEVVLTQKFRNLKIEVKNALLPAKLSPAQVSVTLRGPQRIIESFAFNGGEIFADANGKEAGTVEVPVSVIVPPGIEILSREPEVVSLTLVDDSKKKPRKPRTRGKTQRSGVHR